MKVYKILEQSKTDERKFWIEDVKTGERKWVDFYTDGGLDVPNFNDVDYGEWIGSFVGKTIEIEEVYPASYFTAGRVRIVE